MDTCCYKYSESSHCFRLQKAFPGLVVLWPGCERICRGRGAISDGVCWCTQENTWHIICTGGSFLVGQSGRFYLCIFRREGKREREASVCGCLSCAPYWAPGPQPRHVPWLGIELATLCLRPVLNPLSHTSWVERKICRGADWEIILQVGSFINSADIYWACPLCLALWRLVFSTVCSYLISSLICLCVLYITHMHRHTYL